VDDEDEEEDEDETFGCGPAAPTLSPINLPSNLAVSLTSVREISGGERILRGHRGIRNIFLIAGG
jgi:hypothetical protein